VHSYQLENKSMDVAFLEGKPVLCDAVIPVSEYERGLLTVGERIVVLLSTGKKYMAEVISFAYRERGSLLEGKLEIMRYFKK
jgi:hypothetical protein